MSMDRKNKKAAQVEAREKEGKEPEKESSSFREGSFLARQGGNFRPRPEGPSSLESAASPVPIRSALSSSIQSPPPHRIASSPLREPIGPPPLGPTGGTSPGFARSPVPATAFASSPNRPSPLSASFNARSSIPGPLSLKSQQIHSPLRPPTYAFSSSFSHSSISIRETRQVSNPAPPLSASFADGMRKNIWARHETPADQPEVLSPRRHTPVLPRQTSEDVFEGDLEDDDHGEDLLPSSLSELLTPQERARRVSRRDSNESYSASPSRNAFLGWGGGERLAQSAGATMGPGFLQGLWSAEGADARKAAPGRNDAVASPSSQRQSLLTQQRSPGVAQPPNPLEAQPFYPSRPLGDPSSPGTRALQEHAPGQSLPGGLANALSRLHMHGPRTSSGLVRTATETYRERDEDELGKDAADKQDEHEEEGLFAMDG